MFTTIVTALVTVFIVIMYDYLGVSAAVAKHVGLPGKVQIFGLLAAMCIVVRLVLS